MYQQFLKHLAINGNGYRVQPINPEDLILRFANRLEFHPETMQVAKDAVRIVQRMNRDWMTPGRRPAGVCGAALILAARMNNFRRSVREVVYVVKVQEQTICNRLEEFKDTESSGLTVEEFRAIDLERFADPPAYSQQKEGNKKRGRKRKHVEFGDDGDGIEPTVISSRATSTAPSATNHQLNSPTSPQHQAQIDSQTMPPPPLPIDPNLIEMSIQHQSNTESSPASEPPDKATGTVVTETPSSKSTSEPPPKRKRGCKPKIAAPPASQITDDQPFDARTLGSDLTAALTDPTNLDHANALHSALESASDPPAPPETQQEQSIKPRAPIPYTEDISDSEFADDPEVSNCLLTESEVAVKTRIWTHENRDYLRKQSAKILKQQLAEANGTARVIVRRRRRKKRMGDMRAYVGEDEEEGRPVAGSPADAVAKMMGRRAYSKKINYESILTAYAGSSASGSRRGSDAILAGSPGSGVDMPRPLEMSGALQVTSPGAPMRDTDPGKKGPEETEDGGSAVGGNAKPEEQQALDSIAGELEEGINESDDDDDEAVEEESVYGQGYDSD